MRVLCGLASLMDHARLGRHPNRLHTMDLRPFRGVFTNIATTQGVLWYTDVSKLGQQGTMGG